MAMNDPLREGDANRTVVGEALDQIAVAMERQPKYFDPELPRAFRFIAESVRDPVGATKAVVFGAVRSAENLISFLGQRALGIATKAADAVEQHISKAVAITEEDVVLIKELLGNGIELEARQVPTDPKQLISTLI